MKNIILFLSITFLLFNIPLSAKVIPVSAKMSADKINSMLSKAQPGDTLFFGQGHYKVNLILNNIHGALDNPVVLKGENRKTTVIDGGAHKPGVGLTNYGITINDCSWITIDDFSFQNCWLDVIRAENSGYISLRNSDIHGGRRAVFTKGRGSHHYLIENCFWEQGEHVWTKENEYSWAELHHGEFRHYNGGLLQAEQISGSFVLRDNYIKNVYNGFRLSIMGQAESDTLACTNGEIYRNVIENSSDNAFEPEVYCRNLHFYHNKMINSHAFISVTEVGGGPLYIYGNTGVKLPDCEDGWTIFKFTGKKRRLIKPIYIFNNSWQVDSDVLGRKQEKHWHSDNIRHFNNAYHITNADSVGIYYLGKNNVFENDCANIPFPHFVSETGRHKSIVADPMFVDGKYGNFRLQKDSPCRDAGIIPHDIEIAFNGDKLDIGAYDDDVLVEGPPFRHEDLKDIKYVEQPRIVKYKISGRVLKLWFSSPLNPSTISESSFVLRNLDSSYKFSKSELQNDGYVLVLESNTELPADNISLSVSDKPIGINGQQMTYWASAIPTVSSSKAEQTLTLTKKVADYLIETTSFDFEPKVVTFNANLAQLTIEEEILRHPNQAAYGLISINAENEKKTILGFSFTGNIKLFLNGKQIYAGQSNTEDVREYTYNRFTFDNQIIVNLNKGENSLLVKCMGGDKGVSFSCCAQLENDTFDNTISIKNNIAASYINNWLVTGIFNTQGNAIDSLLPPEQGFKEYYKYNNKLISWSLQSPLIQRAFTAPVEMTNKKGFDANWHYANSNTLLGILNLYRVTDDYRYKRFVEGYNKQVVDNYDFFKDQYENKRIMRGAYFRLFRASMLDDTGGAILPMADMAMFDKPGGLQTDLLHQTLDYVLNKQQRLTDGTLCRPEPIDNTVWADDLFMSVPFLLRMAALNNEPRLYDEVALQIINFNKYLTEKKTNLYRHGWYSLTNELSPVAWSRANGWVIWAMSEALMHMPKTHKDYKTIQKLFTDHLKTILSYQSEGGLWHQIIDDSNSYLETSGSAMFALGLSRAINNGWMPYSYNSQLIKAWDVVSRQIRETGIVDGICRGTDMGKNADYYINQKPLENDPRGLGAVLTLGTEMYRFFNKKN